MTSPVQPNSWWSYNILPSLSFTSSPSRNPEHPLSKAGGDAQLPSAEQPLVEAEQLDDAEQEGAEEDQAEHVLQHDGTARELYSGGH